MLSVSEARRGVRALGLLIRQRDRPGVSCVGSNCSRESKMFLRRSRSEGMFSRFKDVEARDLEPVEAEKEIKK